MPLTLSVARIFFMRPRIVTGVRLWIECEPAYPLRRMTRLFLLDGTALAYRAHFALQRSGLSTPEGKPVGATYGFTMTLRRILEQEKPELIAVAFDPPGDTFRHELYDEYKATRQKMPDDLIVQQ